MRHLLIRSILAAVAFWAAGQTAAAQDLLEQQSFGPNGRIFLFDRPGFNGGSYSANGDVPNLARTGFNDRAVSVAVRRGERWQLCEHANYRGRCVTVDRDIANLASVGLANMVSSLRRVGGGGGGGDRGPGLSYRAPYAGETAVFYPTPRRRNGSWVEACSSRRDDRACQQQEADRFCREMGNRENLSLQTRNGYLIDVLCRR
jgi:hypothetical protein